LLNLLETSGKIVGAIGVLVTATWAGVPWLEPFLGHYGAVAVLLLGTGALVAFVWIWQRTRSTILRPDAFLLQVTTREDLIGRRQDIDDLKDLVEENAVVFLVGESGTGKSALVSAGLAPALRADGRYLPVLMNKYGDDWAVGPLRETIVSIWEAA